jgi:2-amino-4-hydroxy-6-hydroxymethyldihydropteridine diphosphokinase
VNTIAYIGFGSNVGDRCAHLNDALERLARVDGVEFAAASPMYESAAIGGPAGQDRFLNAVVSVRTRLDAAALLTALSSVEQQLGRRRSVRWGPRTIDLDILLFGDSIIRTAELCVPHPGFASRRFVLAPLADLNPDLRDPVSGRTAGELLAACPEADCRPAVGQGFRSEWTGGHPGDLTPRFSGSRPVNLRR